MQLFTGILTSITLPILLLVALGYGVQSRAKFDLATLSKLQIYVLIPCAILHFLVSARLPLGDALPTVWFTVLQFAAHFAVGWALAVAFGVTGPARTILALVPGFNNSGNYGLPLIQLTFPPDYLLHQTIVLSMHMVLLASVGLWMMARHSEEKPKFLQTVFATPMIPAVALGLALKGMDVTLPVALAIPLMLMGEAFTPLALFLLGAQLAGVTAIGERGPLALGLMLKLIAAPAITWGLSMLCGFSGELTALFVLGSATPVGVMVAVFAARYNTAPALTASTVFISTVLSALTVTAWIFVMQMAGLMPAMPAP
ncbi:MAG: AEC family transporter [Hyphomicrobiales bacterium]|mgnify:CR=1 FL=1|nr:AEC family transporter [Hyphomicrobiales bacterium]